MIRNIILVIIIITLPLLLESLNIEIEKIESIDFSNKNNKNNIHGISFINDNMSGLQFFSLYNKDFNFYEGHKLVSFDSKFEVKKELPLESLLYSVFSKNINGNIFYINFDSLKSFVIPLDSISKDSLIERTHVDNINYFFDFCYNYDGYSINRRNYNRDCFYENSFFYNQFYYYVSDNNHAIIEYDIVNKKVRIINFNFKDTKLGKYKDFKIAGFINHKMILYNRIRGSIIFYDLLAYKWDIITYDLIYRNIEKKLQDTYITFHITSNNIFLEFLYEDSAYIYKLHVTD
jgi:hypothetical protein